MVEDQQSDGKILPGKPRLSIHQRVGFFLAAIEQIGSSIVDIQSDIRDLSKDASPEVIQAIFKIIDIHHQYLMRLRIEEALLRRDIRNALHLQSAPSFLTQNEMLDTTIIEALRRGSIDRCFNALAVLEERLPRKEITPEAAELFASKAALE